jgi:uncharacterized protein (TIGR03067 family)
MRSFVAAFWVILVSSAVFADDTKVDAKDEAKKLQGTWLLSSENGTKTEKEDNRLVIAGEKLTLYGGGKASREFTFTLDPTTTPKQIDLTRKKNDGTTETALAIYVLKGDELRICSHDKKPNERPKEFKADEKADLVLFTLKRKKE